MCSSRIILSIVGILLLSGGGDCQNRKLDCECSDVDPRFGRDKHLKYVRYRCIEHRARSECEKSFIYNTPEELPEGYCQITCGRCKCCKTLRNVAEEEKLTDWIWAMEVANLDDLLDNPGIEVSALVPGDGALDELLRNLGDWSRSEVKSDKKKQAVLGEVLKFNMVSALPKNWAVYSAPFFKEGLKVQTEYDARAELTVREWGGGSIGFQGTHNSATVNAKNVDRATCKGYIQITDKYALPFEDGARLMKEPSEPGKLPAMCQTAEQTVYDGQIIDTIKADNAEACCLACNNRSKCNVWSFCARETGCHKVDGTSGVWWGDCQLKRSVEVQNGDDPVVMENSILTPYHSGHLSPVSGSSTATRG